MAKQDPAVKKIEALVKKIDGIDGKYGSLVDKFKRELDKLDNELMHTLEDVTQLLVEVKVQRMLSEEEKKGGK